MKTFRPCAIAIAVSSALSPSMLLAAPTPPPERASVSELYALSKAAAGQVPDKAVAIGQSTHGGQNDSVASQPDSTASTLSTESISWVDNNFASDKADGFHEFVRDGAIDVQKASTPLAIAGNVGYSINSGQVTVSVDRINNNTPSTTSGSLVLRLWYSKTPVLDQTSGTGYLFFNSPPFGPVQPQNYLTGSATAPYLGDPPTGTYYVVLTLGEYSSSGCAGASPDNYCVVNTMTFSQTVTISSSVPPPPPPPSGYQTVVVAQTSYPFCFQYAKPSTVALLGSIWPDSRAYADGRSCGSLGYGVYAGKFVSDTVAWVYDSSVAFAQIDCDTGIAVQCSVGNPPAVPPPPIPAPVPPVPAPVTNAAEPSIQLPVVVNPAQACPGYYVANVGLRTPGNTSDRGQWGLQMLLSSPDPRLLGGLNFGGYGTDQTTPTTPGFAAFSINNPTGAAQKVDFTMRGDGGLYDVLVLSTIPPNPTRTTVFSQRLQLSPTTPTIRSVQLSNGFHIISLLPINGTRVFNVSAATSLVNGGGAAFSGGAVVGGYVTGNQTGFAALCTADSQVLPVTTYGRPYYGAIGAGALQLTVFEGITGKTLFGDAFVAGTPPPPPNPLTFTTFPVDANARELGRARIGSLVVDNWYTSANSVAKLAQSRVTIGKDNFKVFTDAVTGRIARVDNELSKASVVFRVLQDRTELWFYEASGAYVGGLAAFKRGADWYSADILGTPAQFDQIELTLGSFGSAALTPTATASLANERRLDASFGVWIDKFEAEASKRVETEKLSASGAKACQGFAGLGAALGVVVAGSYTAGLGAFAGAVPGAMLGWIACAAVTDGYEQITQPISDTLRDAADASDSTNFMSRVSSRIRAGAIASLLARPAATPAGSGDLRTPFTPSPAPYITTPPKIPTNVEGIAVTPNNSIYQLFGTVSPTGSIAASGRNPSNQLLSITAQSAPCAASSVNEGSFKTLRTIRELGAISPEEAEGLSRNANDIDMDAQKSLSATGCATGSYTAGSSSGTVQGRETTYGQCAVVTQSGGQGTFSRVYDVGKASGKVTFSYDAYSIPDAFTVTNGGTTAFTTGGLVSGTGSKVFDLTSRNVFVTVSAPNSGTLWEFRLTCP